VTNHGYGAYASGCRCDVCRKAKAEYMSKRRKAAVAARKAGDPMGSVKHGTRYAYEERGCRCSSCSEAHSRSDKRVKR
jgi:hypothetical protein